MRESAKREAGRKKKLAWCLVGCVALMMSFGVLRVGRLTGQGAGADGMARQGCGGGPAVSRESTKRPKLSCFHAPAKATAAGLGVKRASLSDDGSTIQSLCEDHSTECFHLAVFYFIPKDVPRIPGAKKEIERAVLEIQEFFRKQLGGYSFSFANPLVRVVESHRDSAWLKSGHSQTGSDYYHETEVAQIIHQNIRYLFFSDEGPDGKGPLPYRTTRMYLVFNGVDREFGLGGGRMSQLAGTDLKYLMSYKNSIKNAKVSARDVIVSAAAHEFGHALGLLHSQNSHKCDNSSWDPDGVMAHGWSRGLKGTFFNPFQKDILWEKSETSKCNYSNTSTPTPGLLYLKRDLFDAHKNRRFQLYDARKARGIPLAKFSLASLQQCTDKCATTQGCSAFTYNPSTKWCEVKQGDQLQRGRFEGFFAGIQHSTMGQKYELFDSRKAAGENLQTLHGIYRIEDCAAKCDGHSSCRSFSYRADKKKCYLMSALTLAADSAPGHSAGLPRAYYYVDFSSQQELSSPNLQRIRKVPSPVRCAEKCRKDSRCKAFSYSSTSQFCDLKANPKSTSIAKEGVVSGVLRR